MTIGPQIPQLWSSKGQGAACWPQREGSAVGSLSSCRVREQDLGFGHSETLQLSHDS
jgi:hypothetical protein